MIALAVSVWWLHHFRAGYPLDIDESRYLAFGLRLHDQLSSGGPAGLWHAWSSQHDFGPLLPLVSVPFYALFGSGVFVGLVSQLVFFALLLVAGYGIGARLSSPAGGLLAALVLAATPAVIDFSRTYQFAITDAAVLAAATYALLASEAFERRGWSLVWGVLLGLTPLARTMAIAFLPAQLIAAVWLIVARRGRWVNLALALGLGVLVGATWLAGSWSSVSSYLTNFGYGAQSAHFAHSGSKLSVGYWTREAVDSVREDLYLPLAALLAITFLAGAFAWMRQRRGVRWRASDGVVVAFVLLEGYIAVSSSRNEGVGFRVPLLALLVALGVATLLRLPWTGVRRALIAGLVALSALNLVMKADIIGGLSGTPQARVPGFGAVPVVSGAGYIQGYVASALEARAVPAPGPLPPSARQWLPAYARIVQIALRGARHHAGAPVIDLATDEPLLNDNDLILAARLHDHRDVTVNLVPAPPGAASAAGYARLLQGAPDAVVTVGRPGFSYSPCRGAPTATRGCWNAWRARSACPAAAASRCRTAGWPSSPRALQPERRRAARPR